MNLNRLFVNHWLPWSPITPPLRWQPSCRFDSMSRNGWLQICRTSMLRVWNHTSILTPFEAQSGWMLLKFDQIWCVYAVAESNAVGFSTFSSYHQKHSIIFGRSHSKRRRQQKLHQICGIYGWLWCLMPSSTKRVAKGWPSMPVSPPAARWSGSGRRAC